MIDEPLFRQLLDEAFVDKSCPKTRNRSLLNNRASLHVEGMPSWRDAPCRPTIAVITASIPMDRRCGRKPRYCEGITIMSVKASDESCVTSMRYGSSTSLGCARLQDLSLGEEGTRWSSGLLRRVIVQLSVPFNAQPRRLTKTS
jgi:hypothetical protein